MMRKIALYYLRQNPMIRPEVAIPLAESQAIEKPGAEVIDFLLDLGRRRFAEVDRS